MFLPVLLIRDYGIWGYLFFAVPNIVGAGAMGWIVRSPDMSRDISAAHHRAILAFSFITIAYQTFFAEWIFRAFSIDSQNFSKATFAFALIAVSFPSARRPANAAWIALGVLIISCVCGVSMTGTGALTSPSAFVVDLRRLPKAGSIAFLPVSCFGFLLCPYLDRTFHAARQSTSDGRVAFGIGFGVVFLSVLIFSLSYAGTLAVFTVDSTLIANNEFLWWLSIYFVVQLGFTMGVHFNGGEVLRSREAAFQSFWLTLASILFGLIAYSCTRFLHHHLLGPGELMYRIFLSFYGLVFPAYVWLCMIRGRGRVAPNRRQWIVLAVAIVLAAPMYWMGFIEGKMLWLLPGLAVVVLARMFVSSSVGATLVSPAARAPGDTSVASTESRG
jgi:hypothetical protein